MNEPEVIRFKSLVSKDKGKVQIELPPRIAKKFSDEPQSTVEVVINDYAFRTSLLQNSLEKLSLNVKPSVIKGARLSVGVEANVAMLGPEPEPKVPSDLKDPLTSNLTALKLWEQLTPMNRRDWIRWITLAKTEDTRARRIKRTIDQLSEGKRRACCVNVYEYVLSRVENRK